MVIMPIQKHKVRGGDRKKNGGGSKEGAGREGRLREGVPEGWRDQFSTTSQKGCKIKGTPQWGLPHRQPDVCLFSEHLCPN